MEKQWFQFRHSAELQENHLMNYSVMMRFQNQFKTSDGGAEIVGLLKTGSAYFAPSSAAATMVKSIVSDSNEVMPACSWVDGEFGINGVFLGVPTKLGANGVTEVVEIDLEESELNALKGASEAVKAKVQELNSILSQ